MPQWVNAWLFLALWAFSGKNRDIFMAAICDSGMVSWSQIFPWNRSWLNKNRFHEKEGGQFLHTNNIYCVLLAINSSKQRKDNQCLARYRWCLLRVYHDTYLNIPVHISWLAAARFDLFLRCLWCIILLENGKHCGVFMGDGCDARDTYVFPLGWVFVCNLL